MMDIRPIRNKKDHDAMLARIETLFDAEPGTAEGDELDVLFLIVEDYESKHFSIEPLDPIEFIKCTMELRGEGQKELSELLNSRSRASEILNRKRPLTLDQIRKISKAWNVPAEAMFHEYELSA
jgi:HTH-type transcriptional regulator/antitoxin HigA